MPVYTVSLTDGTTLANLAVAAGRGPKGDGFTGVTYNTATGRFVFTSNDGLGFTSDDITVDLDAAVVDAEAARDAAQTARDAAQAAQSATENIFDQFGDQYLGPKASDPTVDNDGDPLTEGDIYFNTTDDVLKFYSGTAWVAPEVVATTAANNASNSASAASSSATSASNSASAALTSEQNADASETNAANSAAAALTSEQNAASSAASINPNSIDINGGTIDGTVIGGSTPAAISGTTGTFSGQVRLNDTNHWIDNVGGSDISYRSGGTHNFYSGGFNQRLNIASNGDISFYEDLGVTAQMVWDASADALTFRDNVKATFGAGSDLQIYHTGTHSIINENGVGDLLVQANAFKLQNAAGTATALDYDPATGALQLYKSNAAKLATTATGIDVTGTVTADGLTVDGGAAFNLSAGQTVDIFRSPNFATLRIGEDASNHFDLHESGDDFFMRETDASVTRNRIRISSGGDISFYEDTGATPKFYWDASAERLGLGTSSPGAKLHIVGPVAASSGTSPMATFSDGTRAAQVAITGSAYSYAGVGANELWHYANGAFSAYTIGSDGAVPIKFVSNAAERLRITSTGNVGIGTSSPNAASIVDAQSTTKGVRFPNMTTAQKTAIANVAGNVVFDTTLGKLCVNSGSGWETITSI